MNLKFNLIIIITNVSFIICHVSYPEPSGSRSQGYLLGHCSQVHSRIVSPRGSSGEVRGHSLGSEHTGWPST